MRRRTFLSGVVGLPAMAGDADKFDVAAFDGARVGSNGGDRVRFGPNSRRLIVRAYEVTA